VSIEVLILVVIAAMLHATWNYLLKKCGGGLGVLTLSAVIASIWLTPISLYFIWQGFTFSLPLLGVVVGSGVIHMLYFLLLDRAYRSKGGSGDLSVVYPLARATGPLITIIVATMFFDETMSAIALCGALLIGISALTLVGDPRQLITAQSRQGIGFALLCGCMIASYTVWDKQAVAVFLIPPIIFDWAANVSRVFMLAPYTHFKEPSAMKNAWRQHPKTILAIGIMSPLSYILVLTAMVTTPVSYVAPARELSILFAALLGAHVLKEGDVLRRTIAAIGMLLGVVALAIG
jgi:drug/metabolite transporter (DMT)-like permease